MSALRSGVVGSAAVVDLLLARALLMFDASDATGGAGANLLVIDAVVVIHVVVAFVTGFALADALPSFVRTDDLARDARWQRILSFMMVALFLPVVGGTGMLIAMRFGSTEPGEQSRQPWLALDVESAIRQRQRHPLRSRRTVISVSDIRAVLTQRTRAMEARRFEAVLAIQHLPAKVAVPLFKLAQTDPSDEIRLYAFSRLERMRDELESQAQVVTSALETAPEHEAARLHLRLAQSHWELGYLGLAEGAVLEHAMKSAHHHAAIATEKSPMHAPAEFFLGRVLLHLREPQRATIAFERAIRAGYPRVRVLPWLAECAFHERDLGGVSALLAELAAISPETVFFHPVLELWAPPKSVPRRRNRASREPVRISAVRDRMLRREAKS